MRSLIFGLLLSLAVPVLSTAGAQGAYPSTTRTYRVKQTATVSEIPAGSKDVKFWVSIPDNDRHQDVLNIDVAKAPGPWKVVRDLDRGNRFLLVEVANPTTPSLDVVVEFTVTRRSTQIAVDAAKVGALSAGQKTIFAPELVLDAPHMTASADVRAMADKACGDEKNLATQAKALLNAVAAYADHYSKDPTKPKCGIGDAGDCMTNKGGCCTDLHSLFIAMARYRGIPSRLQMGYRCLEKNDGKEVDPGYRCWAEYFLPGYGWVPADIVEADAEGGLGPTVWFTGLTERRVWLNEGREFGLADRKAPARVNTMIIGYCEIDGVPARVLPDGDKAAQLTRKVFFTEVKPDAVSATGTGK